MIGQREEVREDVYTTLLHFEFCLQCKVDG